MKLLFLMMMFANPIHNKILFDFNKNISVNEWRIVDDVVMGGNSSGTFRLNEDGHGMFSGDISLENNGGFSSVRYRFPRKDIGYHSKVVLRVKGDGKNYQFRVKDKSDRYYSYVTSFATSGEWEEIEIDLEKMYPSFRGRRLNQSNFSSSFIEEIVFLIGNKKKESFRLLIDSISLK